MSDPTGFPPLKVHTLRCAAWLTRPVPDCVGTLVWHSRADEIDPAVPAAHGWQFAVDRWVCPANHRPDLP